MATPRKMAFLDTNVLHHIDLYLRRAGDQRLYPLNGGEAAAYSHLADGGRDGPWKSLTKGLNAVVYLRHDDVRVEYSVIAEIELMAGRARGVALERAAAEGIPDRMWTRFREREVNDRLQAGDLTAIQSRVEGIGRRLEEAGIDAAIASASRTRDALELARDVAAAVYMSVADCIVYAGALAAEADELISDDGYLSKTVNRLRDDPVMRDKLEQRVAAIRSAPRRRLPAARKIPAGKFGEP